MIFTVAEPEIAPAAPALIADDTVRRRNTEPL